MSWFEYPRYVTSSLTSGVPPSYKEIGEQPYYQGPALEFRFFQEALNIGQKMRTENLSFLSIRESIFRGIEYPYSAELWRFALALQGYSDSPNPIIDPISIWINSVTQGPSYAKYLKRVKEKSVVLTLKGEFFTEPEWFNDVPGYIFKDIGDIFNFKYLPNWKEPEESDIDEYCSIPVNEIDEEDLTMFREICRGRLSTVDLTKVRPIPQEEILLEMSNKREFGRNPISIKKFVNPSENYMASKFQEARSAFIQKTPGDCRDIVINQIATSNRVKWIDKQLLDIIEQMPEVIHVRDPTLFYKRIDSLKENFFFICRDLEKEGLTKPRILLQIMLEELYDYTKLPAFEPFKFYEEVKVNGKSLKRGHGLGMANSLTTLMQVILYDLTCIECLNEYGFEIESNACFLNDDSAVGMDNPEHADYFWEADGEVLARYQHRRKDKKSFRSRGFVICEQYYSSWCPSLCKKESYLRYQAMKPLYAVNIAHAKEISGGLNIPEEILSFYKGEYVAFWGYEFFPEEIDLPARFGGWGSFFIGGVDMSVYIADQRFYLTDHKIGKALRACSHTPKPPKGILKAEEKKYYRINKIYCPEVKKTPFMDIFKASIEECELLDIPTTLTGILEKSFQWSDYPSEFNLMWQRLKIQRLKTYRIPVFFQTPEEIYHLCRKTYKNLDFFPPESIWPNATWNPIYYKEHEGRAYRPDFPNLAALAYVRQARVAFINPNGLVAKHLPIWNNMLPGQEWSWLDDFSIDLSLEKSYSRPRIWEDEKEGFNPYSSSFLMPGSICEIFARLGKRRFPVFNFTAELLAEKESVWDSILTPEEECILGQYKGPIDILISLVKKLNLFVDIDLIDVAHEVILDFYEQPNETPPPEIVEEIEEAPEELNLFNPFEDQINLWYQSALDQFAYGSAGAFGWQINTTRISRLGANPGSLKLRPVQDALRERLSLEAFVSLMTMYSAMSPERLEELQKELQDEDSFWGDEGGIWGDDP